MHMWSLELLSAFLDVDNFLRWPQNIFIIYKTHFCESNCTPVTHAVIVNQTKNLTFTNKISHIQMSQILWRMCGAPICAGKGYQTFLTSQNHIPRTLHLFGCSKTANCWSGQVRVHWTNRNLFSLDGRWGKPTIRNDRTNVHCCCGTPALGRFCEKNI